MTKILSTCSLFVGMLTSGLTQEWSHVPIPAFAGNGKVWELQSQHSDDFSYTGKPSQFTSKWLDNHRAGWSGPGETQFSSNHSWVHNGNLVISAGRVTNIPGKRVFCGHVTTKNPVMYPVYTEVMMRISGLKLSSNFWLLSADDVNEIDVNETYGNEPEKGKEMGTNYHIFQRQPFLDLANSPKAYRAAGEPLLRNGFHRFGVYWKSPTEFEYYLNGVLVRRLNTSNDLRDPRGRFFDQPMHLIMNTESHTWRSEAGISPTDAELNNNSINKMYVAWIRTYKPVAADASIPIGQTIALKAVGNGKYVSADRNLDIANWPLAANRTAVGAWEKFEVIDAGGGKIALKAVGNGKFVASDKFINATHWPLAANRSVIGAWEKFTWQTNGDGTISLKANGNGNFIASDKAINAVHWPLNANRTAVGAWEKFNFEIK